MPKIYFDDTQINLTCDTSNWTEFYTISIGDANIPLEITNLMIAVGHNHLIKIELDGETFIEADIVNLANILIKNKAINFNIDMIKNGSNYNILFKFKSVFVDTISVLSKRRNGHGKLNMDAILVNYLKRIE